MCKRSSRGRGGGRLWMKQQQMPDTRIINADTQYGWRIRDKTRLSPVLFGPSPDAHELSEHLRHLRAGDEIACGYPRICVYGYRYGQSEGRHVLSPQRCAFAARKGREEWAGCKRKPRRRRPSAPTPSGRGQPPPPLPGYPPNHWDALTPNRVGRPPTRVAQRPPTHRPRRTRPVSCSNPKSGA